jgi:hypothetical protein
MDYQHNIFANVSPPKPLSETRKFFQSQNFFSQIAFLTFVIVLFVILLKVITKIMVKVFTPSKSPYLLKNLKSADIPTTISQNPSAANSVPIIRSTNQKDGIEFTYNIWLFINGIPELTEKNFHQVFFKGNTNTPIVRGKDFPDLSVLPRKVFKLLGKDLSGINYPDNGPGLYLTQLTSNSKNANSLGLVVVMNTFRNILEPIVIPDIPFKKWLCTTIRVMGRNIDVYINGIIVKRVTLRDIPKQNYGDIYINNNKGFNGSVSGLRYYNYGLNAKDIYNIVASGPNITADDSLLVSPPYYSSDWYFDEDKI